MGINPNKPADPGKGNLHSEKKLRRELTAMVKNGSKTKIHSARAI